MISNHIADMYKNIFLIVLVFPLWITLFGCLSQQSNQVFRSKNSRPKKHIPQKLLSENRENALEHFIDGSLLEQTSNYKDAISEYKTALSYDSSVAVIHYTLGKVYLATKDKKNAIYHFEKSVELDIEKEKYTLDLLRVYLQTEKLTSADSLFRKFRSITKNKRIKNKKLFYNVVYALGISLSQNGNKESAIEYFENYLEHHGYNKEILLKLIDLYLETERYEKTVLGLKEFIANNEENSYIYRLMGEAYEKLKMHDKAEEAYKKSKNLSPSDFKIRLKILDFYTSLERWDEFLKESKSILRNVAKPADFIPLLFYFEEKAKKDDAYIESIKRFGEAINSIYPSDPSPTVVLGNILLQKKKYAYAEKIYRSGLKKYSKNFQIRNGFAQSLSSQKKYAEAIKFLKESVNLLPERQVIFMSFLGYLLFESGETDECVKILEALHQSNKVDNKLSVQNYSILGLAYDRLNLPEKSEAYYKKVLFIEPENAMVLNNLAYLFSTRGKDLEDGLAMIEKAIQIEPENAAFLDTKGWLLFQLKKYEEAKIHIQKSLTKRKNSAVVQDHLGDIFIKLGNKEKAKKAWERALKYSSKNTSLKNTIEKKIKQLSQ